MQNLYIIHARGTDLYKIGHTTRPIEQRVKELQTSSPHELEVYEYYTVADAKGLESFLHDKYHRKQASGEWFELEKWTLEYIRHDINAHIKDKALRQAQHNLNKASKHSNHQGHAILLTCIDILLAINTNKGVKDALRLMIKCPWLPATHKKGIQGYLQNSSEPTDLPF